MSKDFLISNLKGKILKIYTTQCSLKSNAHTVMNWNNQSLSFHAVTITVWAARKGTTKTAVNAKENWKSKQSTETNSWTISLASSVVSGRLSTSLSEAIFHKLSSCKLYSFLLTLFFFYIKSSKLKTFTVYAGLYKLAFYPHYKWLNKAMYEI